MPPSFDDLPAAGAKPWSVNPNLTIWIVRHGEGTHNLKPLHDELDPSLTDRGRLEASKVILPVVPDLVLVSPMSRTIQTMRIVLDNIPESKSQPLEIQAWPDLRECDRGRSRINTGLTRAQMEELHPDINSSRCSAQWDYGGHNDQAVRLRASGVKQSLARLPEKYRNVLVVSHCGLIEALTSGPLFHTAEMRSYRVARDPESNRVALYPANDAGNVPAQRW